MSREDVIRTLKRKLDDLQKQLPCLLVALFGSYAKGNYNVASDVDLLVIYQGGKKEEAYALVKRTFNIPRLEPHVYPENDYRQMKNTIQKMIRDGIVIYQHED